MHLAGHGYRVRDFVAHTPAWSTRQPREQGLRDEAAAHGAHDGETAFHAVSTYLDGLPRRAWPEVLYASNTPLLHGTLRALRDRRIRIPQDIAIVAFDEFDWAELLSPPVTVVDQRIQEIGTAAGRRLLDLFAAASEARGAAAPVVSQLKPFLRIRTSCGCGAAAAPRSALGNQVEESER